MSVLACKADIICITQITLQEIYNILLVDNWMFRFLRAVLMGVNLDKKPDGVLNEGLWVMQRCEDLLLALALLMKNIASLKKFFYP